MKNQNNMRKSIYKHLYFYYQVKDNMFIVPQRVLIKCRKQVRYLSPFKSLISILPSTRVLRRWLIHERHASRQWDKFSGLFSKWIFLFHSRYLTCAPRVYVVWFHHMHDFALYVRSMNIVENIFNRSKQFW